MNSNEYRKMTQDELIRERSKCNFTQLIDEPLNKIRMGLESGELQDFKECFPTTTTQRTLIGTKVYDLMAYITVEEIKE